MSYSATAVFGGEADTVSFDGHGEFYFLFFALSLTADLTYVGGTDVNHLIGGSEHVVVSWTSTAANWGKSSAGHLDQVKPLEANTTLIVAGQTITATGGQLIVGDGGAITSNFDTLDTLALGDWIDHAVFRLTEQYDPNLDEIFVHVTGNTGDPVAAFGGDFILFPTNKAVFGIQATSADHPEGSSGATAFSFTITRGGLTTGTNTVAWSVGPGSGASADGADFVGGVPPSGTVTFAPGETFKTITVNVQGDTLSESDENFVVTLSGPTSGATIDQSHAAATGIIHNDDAPPPRHDGMDFDGDKHSDILWRDDDGTLAIWEMNGFQVKASSGLGKVASDWKILDTGDFDKDGHSDILWRDDDGTVAIWEMNGFQVKASSGLGKVAADWKILDATGDFDGDGHSDFLWRDDDGTLAIWEMNGFQVKASSGLGKIAADWKILGTADFDGDGHSDILWRDDDGTLAIWEMNGFQVKASSGLGKVAADWKILGTGDFDKDGHSDILWRDDDGTLAIWEMNGFQVKASSSLGKVPTQWKILGISDYDGDGHADILWRHDDGTTAIWEMNGFTVTASQSLGAIPNEWHILT